MTVEFSTPINSPECTVYHDSFLLPYCDNEIDNTSFQDVRIDWTVELECKKFGIVGAIKTVTAIHGTMTTTYYKSIEQEDQEAIELVGELSYFRNKKFEDCVRYRTGHTDVILSLVIDFHFDKDDLYPKGVEVDIKRKTFTIN